MARGATCWRIEGEGGDGNSRRQEFETAKEKVCVVGRVRRAQGEGSPVRASAMSARMSREPMRIRTNPDESSGDSVQKAKDTVRGQAVRVGTPGSMCGRGWRSPQRPAAPGRFRMRR